MTGICCGFRTVLQFLVEFGFNVTFYSFAGSGAWPWTAKDELNFRTKFPQISLVIDRWNFGLTLVQRFKNNLSALAPSLTTRIVAASVPSLTPKWSKLRAEYPDAVYLLNYAMNATNSTGLIYRVRASTLTIYAFVSAHCTTDCQSGTGTYCVKCDVNFLFWTPQELC